MEQQNRTPLEWVSEVTELNEMCEFMKDPAVDEAMEVLVKFWMKDKTLAPSKIPEMIVRLQALAGICALKAKYYTVFEKGGENSKKKNVYYTLEDALTNLVNSLKYSAKFGVN